MIDLTMASLLPILVSCVTATCFTYIFRGDHTLFTFHIDSDWTVERVPATILLGVFCGLVSLYFIRMMTATEGMFARFKDKPYVRLAIGGAMLSLLIFLFPSLYGEGYGAVSLLLNGRTEADWNQILDGSLFYGHSEWLIAYLALVLLTKVFATEVWAVRLHRACLLAALPVSCLPGYGTSMASVCMCPKRTLHC